jgi:hypothetical protein
MTVLCIFPRTLQLHDRGCCIPSARAVRIDHLIRIMVLPSLLTCSSKFACGSQRPTLSQQLGPALSRLCWKAEHMIVTLISRSLRTKRVILPVTQGRSKPMLLVGRLLSHRIARHCCQFFSMLPAIAERLETKTFPRPTQLQVSH